MFEMPLNGGSSGSVDGSAGVTAYEHLRRMIVELEFPPAPHSPNPPSSSALASVGHRFGRRCAGSLTSASS